MKTPIWSTCTALVTVLVLAACAPEVTETAVQSQAPTASLPVLSDATPAIDPALAPYYSEIETLASQIKTEHPRPFRFLKETEFDSVVDDAKVSIRAGTPKRDTLWAFSRIIASIGCRHSGLFYFMQEDGYIEPAQRFPVDVRYVDRQLYVFRPLTNAQSVSEGDIITSINGRPVDDIVAEIYRHISTDANLPYMKRHYFNVSATSYLTYALDFPEEYVVTLERSTSALTLEPLGSFSHAPIISPQAPCQDNLCYRVDDDTNTGIMTVRSFAYYGESGAEFAEFVESAFKDLSERNRTNLVIDVRGNQGGSGLAGAYILRRLANEPFEYFSDAADPRGQELLFETQRPVETGFDGQTYILMDGNTMSAAPHFFALARANDMALLAGETAGGNHSTNDGKIQFTSETSEIDYLIARMRFDVEVGDEDPDAAIIPDIRIPYTVAETLSREDVMMDTLLAEIAKR